MCECDALRRVELHRGLYYACTCIILRHQIVHIYIATYIYIIDRTGENAVSIAFSARSFKLFNGIV